MSDLQRRLTLAAYLVSGVEQSDTWKSVLQLHVDLLLHRAAVYT